jgi:TatD DNase family protein
MWIDSHCHLEPEDFCRPAGAADGLPRDERPEVLQRARAAGVSRLIVIGSGHGLAEVRNAIAFAHAEPQLFAAIGVHPHDATIVESPGAAPSEPGTQSPGEYPGQPSSRPAAGGRPPVPGPRGEALWELIAHLAATEPRVVAVGETGLDYYYKHAPPAHQQALLRRFVRLSARTGKPLSLHIRDAHADAQRIISEEGGAPAGGVVHCFTGGPDEAQSWLALGFHISLSGIVTFKSAAAIQAAAQLVPAARLLLETDCPYLAPVPRRGQRNEPAYLVHTGTFVARLRGVSPAELAATSTRAAEELFRLPACDPAPAAPS